MKTQSQLPKLKTKPIYQLIKEVNHINGDTYYWTIDEKGHPVDNSMSKDLELAEKVYEIICKTGGHTVTRTTIKEYYEA